MSASETRSGQPLHDRAFLLHGDKRNEILTLDEVRQYGIDSFADADYLSLYGMPPAQWHASGVRLLGRTAVECTRDVLADRIGRDIAAVAASLAKDTRFTAIDPFAGSCNTLYWILRHLPSADGLAFECDPQVFDLTRRNISDLDCRIELRRGDFLADPNGVDLPAGRALVVFVAPPWGTALDEAKGLDRAHLPPLFRPQDPVRDPGLRESRSRLTRRGGTQPRMVGAARLRLQRRRPQSRHPARHTWLDAGLGRAHQSYADLSLDMAPFLADTQLATNASMACACSGAYSNQVRKSNGSPTSRAWCRRRAIAGR